MLMIVFFSSQVPIQEIYESFALENLVMMNNKKEKIGWPQMINWILKVLLKNKCQNGLQKIFERALRIVSKFYFQYYANLSKLINFYSP